MRQNLHRQSKSFEERQKRRVILGYVAGVVNIFVWAFVLSRLSGLSAFTINTINVYGVDSRVQVAVLSAVSADIQGDYVGLFSRSNTLLYPKSSILKSIKEVTPSAETVSVGTVGLNTLSVSISQKTPSAIVCDDLPDMGDALTNIPEDKCYKVDEAGFIYEKVDDKNPGNYNVYYIPSLPGKDVIGSYATSTGDFKTIQSFVAAIRAADIDVESVLINESGDYEIYAHNPSSSSIVVIHATVAAGLATEAENLILFWKKMLAQSSTKKSRLSWDEIKLQFPPNVYFTNSK